MTKKEREMIKRSNLGKVYELNLSTWRWKIYNNENEYIKYYSLKKEEFIKILNRSRKNERYIKRGKVSENMTPTYNNCWIFTSINIYDLNDFRDKIENHNKELIFNRLYDIEYQIKQKMRRFPITTKEILDEFYKNNPIFYITKDNFKHERMQYFLDNYNLELI